MNAIAIKKLNPEVRNEIVRDVVVHMYACVDRPTSAFVSKVADQLIEKYPFMRDTNNTLCPSVSDVFFC